MMALQGRRAASLAAASVRGGARPLQVPLQRWVHGGDEAAPPRAGARSARARLSTQSQKDAPAALRGGSTVLGKLRGAIINLIGSTLDEQEKKDLAVTWIPDYSRSKERLSAVNEELESSRAAHEVELERLQQELDGARSERSVFEDSLEKERERWSSEEARLRAEMGTLSKKLASEADSRRKYDSLVIEQKKLDGELEMLRGQLRSADEAAAAAAEAAPAAATELEHPVLGRQIASFPGGRKIFMTPIERLAEVPVWEKQRAFREDRSTAMAASLIKQAKKQQLPAPRGFAGSIVVCDGSESFDGELSKLSIIDGQHRVGAMTILLAKKAFGEAPPSMLVEVHHVQTQKDVSVLFREINMAEPVAEVDLPDLELPGGAAQGAAKDAIVRVINEVADELKEMYPAMFKPTSRCRAPHLHLDTLRDNLYTSGVAEAVAGKSRKHGAAKLMAHLQRVNDKMAARSEQEWRAALSGGKTSVPAAMERALEKAKAEGLFLGLDKSWLA